MLRKIQAEPAKPTDVAPVAPSKPSAAEKPAGKRQLEGEVGAPKAGKLRGWARNPADPAERVELELVADGRVVQSFKADREREDGKGAYGFKLYLNSIFASGWPDKIFIRDKRSGEVLPGGKLRITEEIRNPASKPVAATAAPLKPSGSTAEAPAKAQPGEAKGAAAPSKLKAPAPKAPPALPAPVIEGEVQLARNGVLKGWAWDPSAPDRVIAIEVVVDGNPVGVVQADRLRIDLRQRGIGAGDHAFRYDLQNRHGTAGPVQFLVREQGTGRVLKGGEFTAELPPPPVAATRYRYRADAPKLQAISDLNADMGKAVKTDRAAWLLKALNVSFWADCLDTAHGLAKFAEATLETYTEPLQVKLLARILSVYIACGDRETASNLVRRNLQLVAEDDDTFTMYSVLSHSDQDICTDLLALPSGKLNAWYANAASQSRPRAVESFLATRAGLLRNSPDGPLVLANMAIRRGDEETYNHYVGKVLRHHGVSSDFGLAAGSETGPLINRVRFKTRMASTADGPLVSVIMAAKNAETTIAASVDSILGQTYRNLELLICDDGSTDATLEILRRRYGSHPKVRLFQSTSSQGPYNIRNHLCGEAQGRYITVQDADDISLPERIAEQVAGLAQDDNVLLLHANWMRMSPNGEIPIFLDHRGIRMSTVSTMGRRETFRKCGPYDQVLFGADSQFIERVRALFGNRSIASISKPLLVGSWSETSLTRRAGSEATEDGFKAPDRRRYAERRFRERLLGNYWGDHEGLPNHIAPTSLTAL